MTDTLRFDLNLKQLKVFACVGRYMSFTRAARDLFITQPAVTRQIDALEQYCETRLFSRHKSHLTFTEAGALLYSYAERIMRLAYEAEQAVANLKDNPHGVLRIGTTKTFARYLMPPFILRFHERYPEVRIQLDEGASREMVNRLVYGGDDLGVVGRIPYEEGIESIPFPGYERDQLVVVVPPGHPLEGHGRLSLEEIGQHPLLIREKGSGTRRIILQRFADKGVTPKILLEAGNVGFIKDLVKRRAGIGILGRMSIAEDLEEGSLRALEVDDESFEIRIDLVFPKEGYRPVAAQAFLDFLMEGPP